MMVPDAVFIEDAGGPSDRAPAAAPAAAGAVRGGCDRYSVDHRALLFGSRLGHGGEAMRKGKWAADISRAREQEMIEAQNDDLIAELEAQTSDLKHVVQAIGKEVS